MASPATTAVNQEPRGSIVADERGTPAEAAEKPGQDFGENNKDLPEKMKSGLLRLLIEYKNEAQSARRDEIKRIRQAHEFWKGLQYIYWSESDQTWHLPFEQDTDESDQESPRYAYVTNIYQAFGLSIMAVLSQDWPKVRLWPQSPEQPEDVATATASTDVVELVERNNQMPLLMQDEAFFMWCDGKVGAYVRYVVDGQRFGFHPEQELESMPQKMGEDSYQCPMCGNEEPAADSWGFCGKCGTDMGPENLVQAPVVEVPVVKQVIQMPNGAEVITLFGGLNLHTPPWAREQCDYPYLILETEAHVAQLRAAYPWVSKKLATGITVGEGSTDQYSRTARMQLIHGGQLTESGDISTNMISFYRCWLRPSAFWLLDDDGLRNELLAAFPLGCFVAFAGTEYCESRNEGMDDHWVVEHAYPGDGQNRPAVGGSMISVQERFNTLQNITIESAEYSVPPTYVRSDVFDWDSFEDTDIVAGAHYPVGVPQGQSVRDSFYTPEPSRVSPDVVRHSGELVGPLGQFLTGAFPALFGGEAEGAGGETASGYAMARDQALGRIGIVWRRMKNFHAKMMLLAVNVFRKNRPDDVEVPVLGPGSRFKSKWIRLADLKGNIFAYPESDEQYPTVWGMKRATLQRLMENPDPMIQAVLGHPDNLEVIRRIIGLEELVVPEAESRAKQYREIEELMQAKPMPQMDPLTGQPAVDQMTGEPKLTPSLTPDSFGDDHAVELDTVKRWMNSEQGLEAKNENPIGFENVRAHGMMHEQFFKAQQMQAAVLAAATGAQPGAPGKEESPAPEAPEAT